MSEPMTQKQRIVAHLEAYGPLPRADLIEGLPDVKPTVLDASLSQLKAAGKVDRCDKGWFVAEEGAAGTNEAQEPAGEGTRYVEPQTPQPTPQQVRKALSDLPKVKVEIPNLKPPALPPDLGRYPGPNPAPTAPTFAFHVKTKFLQISITGDDVDALLAIRAVSAALSVTAPADERSAGLDVV